MKSNWRFSFDFKPTQMANAWETCLGIYDNGPGDERRVLRMFMLPNTLDFRMHYEFDSTNTGIVPVFDTHSNALTLNEWNTVEVSQIVQDGNSMLVFKVNGFIYHNTANVNPRTYPALDFYIAYGSWQSAYGQMRNFQFYSADLATDIPALGTYK